MRGRMACTLHSLLSPLFSEMWQKEKTMLIGKKYGHTICSNIIQTNKLYMKKKLDPHFISCHILYICLHEVLV
jgi:hypothetical protein